MENLCAPKPSKLLTVIVDKGKGKKVIKVFNDTDINFQFATRGHGTVSKTMHDYFGLGESLKDILYAVVATDKVKEVMQIINNELHLEVPNSGIAFSIPIKCVASMLALNFITGQKEE